MSASVQNRRRGGRRTVLLLGVTALIASAFAVAAAPSGAEQAGDVAPSASGVDASVPPATPGGGKVLILDSSVSGGITSAESTDAQALGLGVDVVIPATWATLTAGQFASYQAIIIGDPPCGSNSNWAAASANTGTWGPVINGNVITNGTDPVLHGPSHPGGFTLVQKSVAFAAALPGKTGLYADLSCWSPPAGTAVDILNAVEPGWTAGPAGCGDNVAVVATNPILAGLTDADLEGWGCSIHEYFDSWPADFVPIALDTDAAPLYTAPDGTQGTPYIMGRGTGLVAGDISLSPDTGTSDVNTPYTLSAFVQFQGTIQVGATVTLTCTGGPNDGLSTTAVTDGTGTAVFSLTATAPGTDTCTASFVNPTGIPETSNAATVVWTGTIVLAPMFTG
jgi:hypothetical protein